MKKLLLLAFLVGVFCMNVHAQGCFPDGITLGTQSEIDNFLINYPDCNAIDGGVGIIQSNGSHITNLDGLSGLKEIGSLTIYGNPYLTNLNGLSNLNVVVSNMIIDGNPLLTNLSGLGSLLVVGEHLLITNSDGLTSLQGLEELSSVGAIVLTNNDVLTDVSSLKNIMEIPQDLLIEGNNLLSDLTGLNHISRVGSLKIRQNPALTKLLKLESITSIQNDLVIQSNQIMQNLNGLENVSYIGGSVFITDNQAMTNLNGLNNLASIGGLFSLQDNTSLTNLAGLTKLTTVNGSIIISGNVGLPFCSIFPVCNHINNGQSVVISDNNSGCNTVEEVKAGCNVFQGKQVVAEVRFDMNNNCQADADDPLLSDIQVGLFNPSQMQLRTTDAQGKAFFQYLESGQFILYLPHYPKETWNICYDQLAVDPALFGDTILTTFLLPANENCTAVEVDLGLPSFFRSCPETSLIGISVRNIGGFVAQGVQTAFVIPPGLDVLSSVPAATLQSSDTLWFNTGDIPPFESAAISLEVRTECGVDLSERALCFEAFADIENFCPEIAISHPKIKLNATCLGDTIVRFTMKNTGGAPTQGVNEYRIFQNDVLYSLSEFNLVAQQSLTFDLPADGSTWRMEAPAPGDIAVLEGCGGFTPGFVTAFWLDHGPLEYEFDCRQVRDTMQGNYKSSIPSSSDTYRAVQPNTPFYYTIDFQNTSTDTVHKVVISDFLTEQFDLHTFQPGHASHPYTWEMHGSRLEVTFFPISLPTAQENDAASRGFFSFYIEQNQNTSPNPFISNTARIFFDDNTSVLTNTTLHEVVLLFLAVDEVPQQPVLWEILGNPTRDRVTFRTKEVIGGQKQFELYDALGRMQHTASFSEEVFEFQRNTLASGMYFFRIRDERGRVFSGRIVISD